jgi:RNA polymerase sigma factor (sigma-70 family)
MSTVEFNQLLLVNSDFLNPFAITLTRDRESARDLVQETMYRAITNRLKYNAGTNIRAWLYSIMRNVFINNYRKKIKENEIFDSTPNDFMVHYTQTAISNLAEGRLHLKEIQTAIYFLPSIYKDPFLLNFDGYKYHVIAEMLHEPIGTIKSRIHFARKLLKKMISRF